MEMRMKYTCMSFGWYHEFLEEAEVSDLSAAELKLLDMLDRGGMIVHAYRETDPENPELVGRHRRLRAFNSAAEGECPHAEEALPHEVERFLLDPANLDVWTRASETGGVVDQRWAVLELWPADITSQSGMYGKARLLDTPAADCKGR
jgi:hypothetical protein